MSFSPAAKSHNLNLHRELYKSPHGVSELRKAAASPLSENGSNDCMSWRNAYKKKCFDEFKKSRQKLVTKFRNMQVEENKQVNLKDYLQEELEKICLLEAKDLLTVDEAIEIYRQIQAEVITDKYSNLTDKEIEDIINDDNLKEKHDQEVLFDDATAVVCPVCQKNNLIETSNLIQCQNDSINCNFKIDKSKCCSISLNELAKRLDNVGQQHQCSEVPKFLFKYLPDESAFLLMFCDNCNLTVSII